MHRWPSRTRRPRRRHSTADVRKWMLHTARLSVIPTGVRDSVTADDLAVEAAKQKLVELATRDDYQTAIARVRTPERGPKIMVVVLFFLSGGSAVIVGWLAHGLGAAIGSVLLGVFA